MHDTLCKLLRALQPARRHPQGLRAFVSGFAVLIERVDLARGAAPTAA